KSSGEQARGNVSLNRSISTDNLEEINNISSYVKDGMSIQGNKIMYDENNSKDVKSIEALKRKVMVESSDKHKDKVGFVTNLTAHTVKGGNNGYKTNQVNIKEDKEAGSWATKVGLTNDYVESNVYAGEKSEGMADKIISVKNLINNNSQSVNNYRQAKDKLYEKGEEVILGKDQDYEKGFNKLLRLGKDANGNKHVLANKEKEFEILGERLRTADIEHDEYNTSIKNLYKDLQSELKSGGVYTDIMTKELSKNNSGKKGNKEARDVFKEFSKSKKELRKQGITPET